MSTTTAAVTSEEALPEVRDAFLYPALRHRIDTDDRADGFASFMPSVTLRATYQPGSTIQTAIGNHNLDAFRFCTKLSMFNDLALPADEVWVMCSHDSLSTVAHGLNRLVRNNLYRYDIMENKESTFQTPMKLREDSDKYFSEYESILIIPPKEGTNGSGETMFAFGDAEFYIPPQSSDWLMCTGGVSVGLSQPPDPDYNGRWKDNIPRSLELYPRLHVNIDGTIELKLPIDPIHNEVLQELQTQIHEELQSIVDECQDSFIVLSRTARGRIFAVHMFEQITRDAAKEVNACLEEVRNGSLTLVISDIEIQHIHRTGI